MTSLETNNDIGKKANILIVDDQPTNIRSLSAILTEEYTIMVATSGAKALEIARGEKKPDLILLDVLMPEMDGYEVLRRLKADENTRDIPVIFVTAKDADDDEEFGLELGAADYITKPVRAAIAKVRIRNLIDLKRKTNQMEYISMHDGLTGIPNRRLFDDYCRRAWGQAQRNSQPLSVILMDIDYFKELNDHYGHSAGDECLRLVAQALAEQVNRAADMVARYGGDEFAAVLPETDTAGAMQIACRFKDAVAKLAIPNAFSKTTDVATLSIGTATSDTVFKPISMDMLISASDEALYLAKEGGRNRIEQFDINAASDFFEKFQKGE
ncbi:response regulator receiver modulated diguanylate cyclase [Flexistipes sinusarabici DSM 4947]|uniref:diguanylate cyclase n=1 Tax=Flexistipes sinusarabici (strain ATCC 49648 / DSM 4947 / MAS 10) TaxID=717231 RepID=F8E4F1_FLESM|nr:diguanylate cyclase [Flexistipes sinusarabici]AEI14437.1 response regulator receiver modulated diguanylate cyclase [Flexistipes sinusarabici DSM 4947]